MAEPKNIKIIYFDARGRAELCRLMLEAAGRKYDDVRHTRESWPTEKPNTPFGQMPVLEVDGQRFAQSVAMANYIARLCGFYGKTNLDGLKIDQVVQCVQDFLQAGVKSFYESDETKKAEALKNLQEVEVPKYLNIFEKLLKENGTGYFVGNSLTLADFSVYDLLYSFTIRKILTLEAHPLLQALYSKIEGHEMIKEYLAKRKPTEH
ncbi:glutathione S-transferase 3-like [Physella acuta]|uniref:glutathione S-transferase 3-like n=1 Tax=Physella acuta TaxID=109671 RepID=UPI0027DDB5C0|nr:glutathione S-transferase 3-like [Physella acuta]